MTRKSPPPPPPLPVVYNPMTSIKPRRPNAFTSASWRDIPLRRVAPHPPPRPSPPRRTLFAAARAVRGVVIGVLARRGHPRQACARARAADARANVVPARRHGGRERGGAGHGAREGRESRSEGKAAALWGRYVCVRECVSACERVCASICARVLTSCCVFA